MKGQNMKKKALLSSVLTIVLCLSLIAGSTFALFTSESEVNVAVTSGTVNVVATASDLTIYSMGVEQKDGKFENGGTAKLEGNTITLDKMTPGDKATFTMTVENKSDVTIVYRTIVDCIKDMGLFAGLNVTIADEAFGGFAITEWESLEAGKDVDQAKFTVAIELPVDAGNDYQGKEATLCYKVEAVQGNGEPKSTALTQDDNGVYQISDMYDLKVFSSIVNRGATTFAASAATYNAVLTADIDMNGTAFLPIGTSANPFYGSFDGQGYTISNFTVNAASGAGLFGYVGAGNVKIDNSIANVKVDNATIMGNHYGAGIAAYIWGNVTGCTVTNTTVTLTPDGVEGNYDNGDKAGAIAGWANISQLTGNTVDNVTISAYRDMGAIVGCINHEAGGTSNVSGNIVTNTTVLYDNSGKTYADAQANADAIAGRVLSKKVVVNANEYTVTVAGVTMTSDVNVVTEEENLQDLVKKGGNLVLQGDRTETSASGGYSAAGLVPAAGSVLDGNGNELWVNGANGTWDCAIYATGGTIKNLTIGGSFRGIFSAGTSADIVIDNVKIDNVCYTFNSDDGNKAYGVYISNSTLNGWTSYSNVHKEVVFTNCNFGQGTGGYQYAYMRPYAPTILNNCVFEEGFAFDARQTNEITFVNCYVGKTLITADNIVELLGEDAANVKFPVTGGTEGLQGAITAGESNIYLADGNYTLPAVSNGTVTISGSKDTVITIDKPAMHGTDVTFNGVTIQGKGTYTGVQHVKTVTYNNAVIKGSMCLYGDKVVFNNCTFESTDYLWTYGVTEAVFNNCTFNTAGKAILVYNEEGATSALNTVTVNNCTFNATEAGYTGSGDHCAAVEIGSGCPFTVNFTGTNVVDEDFAGLWRDKAATSANAVTVTVDGETVYTK